MNPIRILRSPTAGVRPTGKLEGEIYWNENDRALGVIDALGNPLDLVAVRHFSDLSSYVIGDHVIEAGVLYVAIAASSAGAFVPANWAAFPIGDFLPLTGGTLTGDLIMAAPSAIKGQLAGLDTFSVHLGAEFIVNEYDAAGVAYKAFNIYQNSRIAGFYGGRLNIRDDAVLTAGDPVILRLESRLPQPTTYCSIQGAIQGAVWQIKMPDETPRTGGNVGGNFLIHAFNDTGTPLPTALSIERATGKTTLSTMPSIPGGAAGDTITTDGAGTLSWGPAADLSGYLPLTGGTLTGRLTVGGAAAQGLYFDPAGTIGLSVLSGFLYSVGPVWAGGLLNAAGTINTPGMQLNPVAGAFARISGTPGGTPRWHVDFADDTPETGTNAGSNFRIQTVGDNAALLGMPLLIERATGIATLSAPPIVPAIDINAPFGSSHSIFGRVGTLSQTVEAKDGEEAVLYPAVPGEPMWEMNLGEAVGGHLVVTRYSLGVAVDTPFHLSWANGHATFIGVTTSSEFYATSDIRADRNINAGQGVTSNSLLATGRTTTPIICAETPTNLRRWEIGFIETAGELGGNSGSNFTITSHDDTSNGAAPIPIGTPLTIERATGQATFSMPILETSDVSTKTNITPVDAALDIVSRLTGVFYNQNGGPKRQVGLIAQDTQEALPEVVFQSPPTTNEAGEQTEGLLGVAYGNVVAVLVEAIKELTAKVAALEAAQ